jgi:hypothetical protein
MGELMGHFGEQTRTVEGRPWGEVSTRRAPKAPCPPVPFFMHRSDFPVA